MVASSYILPRSTPHFILWYFGSEGMYTRIVYPRGLNTSYRESPLLYTVLDDGGVIATDTVRFDSSR